MLSVTVKDVDQQLLRLGDWHDLYINQQEYSALLNDKKNKWQNISLMKKLEQSLTKKEALTRRQMIAQLRAIARSRTS